MSTVTPDQPPRPQGKFTWRMLATVLGAQSLVIFFGALTSRGLDPDQEPVVAGLTPFVLMCVLAVVALVGAGLMKRPFGIAFGWGVQVLSILCGVFVPMMIIVGVMFAVLYGYCQRIGRRIDREQAAQAATQQES